MAQRVTTILISDLSGDEAAEGGESVDFSYRGVDYTIDLTAKEAAGFDRAMAMYVEHAQKVTRPRRSGSSGSSGSGSGSGSGSAGSSGTSGSGSGRSGGEHAHRIGNMKKWAAEQGIDYPKRGRLPASLVEAYDAAH